jgi:hypothetical protein
MITGPPPKFHAIRDNLFDTNAAETLTFKLGAHSFIQGPECSDVQLECELSNDSSIKCASEPGRTETQTETRQDHETGNP